jgi:hypothetical protein
MMSDCRVYLFPVGAWALPREQGLDSWRCRSWAGCIINMFGYGFRQAQTEMNRQTFRRLGVFGRDMCRTQVFGIRRERAESRRIVKEMRIPQGVRDAGKTSRASSWSAFPRTASGGRCTTAAYIRSTVSRAQFSESNAPAVVTSCDDF